MASERGGSLSNSAVPAGVQPFPSAIHSLRALGLLLHSHKITTRVPDIIASYKLVQSKRRRSTPLLLGIAVIACHPLWSHCQNVVGVQLAWKKGRKAIGQQLIMSAYIKILTRLQPFLSLSSFFCQRILSFFMYLPHCTITIIVLGMSLELY